MARGPLPLNGNKLDSMLGEPDAIASRLFCQLHQALASLLAQGDRFGLSVSRDCPPSIPLYRGKDSQRILYISPVALQLGKQGSVPPLEIARAIAECFGTPRPPGTDSRALALDWILTVMPPGKLYLELTDPSIAAWLQRSIQGEVQQDPFPPLHPSSPRQSLDLFPIQYAHARCCSLLRMADREGWITLEPLAPPQVGAVIAPDPIPWLDAQAHLKPHHPTERTLISQAIATVDALSIRATSSPIPSPVTLGVRLSQDFLTFHAQCQIGGIGQSEDPDLAKARLGLVALTRKLLKRLLERELGSLAPLEL
jgi:hypothetical protein